MSIKQTDRQKDGRTDKDSEKEGIVTHSVKLQPVHIILLCMYVCMLLCLFVSMYVCMYICICSFIFIPFTSRHMLNVYTQHVYTNTHTTCLYAYPAQRWTSSSVGWILWFSSPSPHRQVMSEDVSALSLAPPPTPTTPVPTTPCFPLLIYIWRVG